MAEIAQSPALPPLPEHVPPDALRDLGDEALARAAEEVAAAERETVAAMAPFDRQLKELRARAAEVATERRRRERAQRHASRMSVREQAGSGEMPTVAQALAAPEPPVPDDRSLREVRAFLATGGEIGFGFATRPGSMSFTDGRRVAQAGTFGEARRLFGDGWEPGAPGLPGLRVHLAGTRIERVVSADDVVVERATAEPSA